ncbi:SRPBCC family protein [Engelhardtia mirabilis]|uniref:Polyketide cyclase / dehydrase and lipid transport n=1 Tax=Engelhardtia mirabilis TaxID=2528011 RepID=A0A518BF27_9BACT|nr:Polyketide cyclase / dehydrase and lipid transport [Planctomycetes bacterium Pla133]QDU99887.1 Polyketide cyclase / dehydrase and lipid transport [Planctomycetes bacterium Pla86]
MKWAWALVLSLLIVVAGVEIAGYFLPSRLDVEREAVIAAPVDSLYAKVADLQGWEEWSPILAIGDDLETGVAFLGPPSGLGAQMEVRFGDVLKVLFTVVEAEEPIRFALNSRSGDPSDDLLAGSGFEGWDEFDLEALDASRTRVRWRRTSSEVDSYWLRVIDTVAAKPQVASQLEAGLVALAKACGAPDPEVTEPEPERASGD